MVVLSIDQLEINNYQINKEEVIAGQQFLSSFHDLKPISNQPLTIIYSSVSKCLVRGPSMIRKKDTNEPQHKRLKCDPKHCLHAVFMVRKIILWSV